jgi:hypothetical protein
MACIHYIFIQQNILILYQLIVIKYPNIKETLIKTQKSLRNLIFASSINSYILFKG